VTLYRARIAVLALGVVVGGAVRSGTPRVPLRPLGTIVARSTERLKSIWAIRPLSNGRVVVMDAIGRRVILLDSSLKMLAVVADTTSGTAKAYGRFGGTILSFTGDSSLYADEASLAFLVIDPDGALARTFAIPRAAYGGVDYIGDHQSHAMYDGIGDIVSRVSIGFPPPDLPPGKLADTATDLDSSVIVRARLGTTLLDTVAALRDGRARALSPSGRPNCVVIDYLVNPLPMADDWTVLRDGTLAVVRAHDYHIDWIAPDGTRSATPPIEHVWVRMTDSAKVAAVDSVRGVDSLRDARLRSLRGMAPRSTTPAPRFGECRAIVNGRAAQVNSYPPQYVDPSAVPDYLPPFIAADSEGLGAVQTDADGNIWIHATIGGPTDGGAQYDVVNRKGVLIDRIQIPGATIIMGYGPGVVYLISRDGDGYHLARAKIR